MTSGVAVLTPNTARAVGLRSHVDAPQLPWSHAFDAAVAVADAPAVQVLPVAVAPS